MLKTPELFDQSNAYLKAIEFGSKVLPQVSIGELWWFFEGVNVGQESSKDGSMRRPCLIIKSVPHSSLIRILPLTTKLRKDSSFQYFLREWKKHGLRKASALLIYQLKCIDKKRLIKKIEGSKVKKSLLNLLYQKHFFVL